MQWSGWIYFGMTVVLFMAFIAAVAYYYSPKMKNKVEGPKYRMLDDDDERTVQKGSPKDNEK